jgi:hypothetical protein
MSNVEFTQQLEAALTVPMTAAERGLVDARVAAAIARGSERHGRGWRRLTTRTALALALLLFLVLPMLVVASAALLDTESPFGLAGASEMNREIAAAKMTTLIPAGFVWPDSLAAKVGTSYSRGGGRVMVEYTAICMWEIDWLDARNAQDTTRLGRDQRVIASIPGWYSYSEPFGSQSYRDVLDRVIAAVARDDPAPVATNAALNCAGIRR